MSTSHLAPAHKCASDQHAPIGASTHAGEISQRIRSLASLGLRSRDISTMLGVHERLVVLLLDEVEQ